VANQWRSAAYELRKGIMPKEALSILDQRTHATYEIPIHDGTIRAMDLRQMKTGPEDFGLMTYDPAFMNTASCRSSITFIDGDKGILRYRGYPIEQLAEKCVFLEVAYLILFGELPTAPQLKEWVAEITHHTMLHETTKKFLEGFRYDAHPMGMLTSTVAALSTVYPESRHVLDPKVRALQIKRLIGKMPTIAAYTYRHSLGFPYVYPDNDFSYSENFMNMLWKMAEPKYQANPILARALDILFILHADHEQNCSANAMRAVGSSQADPFLSTAAACAALSGPLHGGANEEVLKMLDVIGSKDKVPAYMDKVKAGEFKLMGFGHRIYKNYDPAPASSSGPPTKYSKSPAATPSSISLWNWSASPLRTITSSSASSIPTSTSTPASCIRPWASSRRSSLSCSPSPALPGGWPNGRK